MLSDAKCHTVPFLVHFAPSVLNVVVVRCFYFQNITYFLEAQGSVDYAPA